MATLLSPSTLPGETNAFVNRLTARVALPQISVETLIGSQANYEIKLKYRYTLQDNDLL